MSATEILEGAQSESERVQIQRDIDLNLCEHSSEFSFGEFRSLIPPCGVGCADHP